MLLLATTAHAAPYVGLAARGGLNRFGSWNMLTAGVEAQGYVTPALRVVVGKEVFTVRRVLPPELQLDSGVYSEWESIWPWSAGALYGFDLGRADPYAGVDLVAARYLKDRDGSEWSLGGRLRGGVDLELVPHLAYNANLAIGLWSGERWDVIEAGLPNTGLVAQISTGLAVSF
ncbi:MAG: hypothetical protein ABMA64_42680 [Myxococcota bacterium]